MTTKNEDELAGYRQKIDAIDDQLIALLKQRISIVGEVGEYKRRTAPGRCPIRPAREAQMVRRVIEAFSAKSSAIAFPAAAAAAMWRTLIGASTSVEAPLVISVFTPERDNDLYWLTREYFGSAIQIIKQTYVKRVIGDVLDGKAAVGVVPLLRSSDTTYWWTNLAQQGDDQPKVFAQIPFVTPANSERSAPSALAFAKITPEDSGDDHSLLVLEVDHNVSQHKLQTAFANAKLDATWINVATLHPSSRHHLVEIKGFVNTENKAIQELLSGLGNSVIHCCFLGAYATPVSLASSSTNTKQKHELQTANS